MWKDLTMSQRADMMDLYLSKGITSLDDMRSLYDSSISDTVQGTSFSDGGSIHIKPENRGKFTALKKRTGHSATWFKEHGTPAQKKMATFALNARHWKHGYGGNLFETGGDTVGEWVNALYQNNPKEEYLGEPSHHYDFTQTDEWADAHGYYPDDRGHRDDRVKKPAHPSHPSRGVWDKDKFILTDKGIQDSNYILFGLNDGGQDPQANLVYRGGNVVPEITVTPRGNYVYNPYDNIKLKYKYGGHIYDGTTEDSQLMNTDGGPFSYIQRMLSDAQNMSRFARKPSYEEALRQAGERVERQKDISSTVHNDNTWVAKKHGKKKNSELQESKAETLRQAGAERKLWRQEHPYAAFVGDALTAAPFAVAAYPFVAGAGEILAGTAAGQAATSGLTWLANAAKATPWVAKSLPWIDAGLTSYFAAHGLDHAINEGIHGPEDAIMTGLELAPLGRLAKPLYEGVVQPGMRLFNSPLTGNWAKIGNREYRLSPNSLGANGNPIESRTTVPQITAENAASITPELDAAYKEAVESGNRPEALRLLEQAYLKSGIPRTDVTVTPDGHAVGWYHGSEWGNHTIFDSSAMNATIGGTSAHGKVKGNFLTTDIPSAMRYAGSSRYSSADVPEYTSPQTFSEKVKDLLGVYKPRRLYPAERVGDYAPKPERMFDTKGKPAIDHLDKVDNVVYPLYVNPGEDIMRLDFQGKPWSQSPVEFPNNFYLRRHIRDDIAKTYRDEIVPYKDYETAYKAWIEDPINTRHGSTSLDGMHFDDGIRSIEGFNSAPRYETVRLVEERVPNTTNGAVQTAAKEGKASVLMRNVIDSNGGPEGAHYAIDDFVTLKPNQQKLADITYDDSGNLIPLSQRFNWLKDDIRYGLLPFGIGLTGYGLYNVGNEK